MPRPPKSKRPVVAVVVPCYRVGERVLDVLKGIGDEVDHIVVVDDACPDNVAELVKTRCRDSRLIVVRHDRNRGVGGATLSGYKRALEAGADVIVKIDGDGQMDPAEIPRFIAPILIGEADYAKGNRFHDLAAIKGMPALRILGNLVLSFAAKLSSGYWNVFDATNGYTAIHGRVASRLPFERISRTFFFESDMLFHLYGLGAVVVDVPMRARYGGEKSNLRILKILPEFTAKHLRNIFARIFVTYVLKDFSMSSVELVLGGLFLPFGIILGALEWCQSIATGVPATAGQVLLAALPIIVGTQFLIAFLNVDTRAMPKTPLYPRLDPGATRGER